MLKKRTCENCKYFEIEGLEGVCNKLHMVLDQGTPENCKYQKFDFVEDWLDMVSNVLTKH